MQEVNKISTKGMLMKDTNGGSFIQITISTTLKIGFIE